MGWQCLSFFGADIYSGCPSHLLAEFFFGKDFPIAPIWMIDTCILRPEPGSRDTTAPRWVTPHCQSGSQYPTSDDLSIDLYNMYNI